MEALGIDIRFLIAQLINFGVFAFIFVKFLHKPFMAYLADQRKDEDEKERLLSELHSQEEELQNKEKELLERAHKTADGIVNEARLEAEKVSLKTIESAQDEIRALKLRAQKDMDDAKDKMHDEIRLKAIETAQVLAEEVLKNSLAEAHVKDIMKEVTRSLKESSVYEK